MKLYTQKLFEIYYDICYYIKNDINNYINMLVKNPKIATMRMIQSQYKKLFDQVKSTKEPLFLIKGSETQVVVLDMETYKQCVKKRGSINKKVSNKQSKSDRAGYLKNLAGIAKGKYGDPVQFQKEIRKEDIN